MGLFTRLEHEQINRLTHDLTTEADARAFVETTLTAQLEQAREEVAQLKVDIMNLKGKHIEDVKILSGHHDSRVQRLTDQAEQARHYHDLEMARRDGMLEVMKDAYHLLNLIREQHEWVRDGQTYSHGVLCDVWKCGHEMGDPNANPRILLPAGTPWREKDVRKEGTVTAAAGNG